MRLLNHLLLLPSLLRSTLAYTALSDSTLELLPHPGDDFDINKGAILSPILQTRVPGTPGSDAVLTHLFNFFNDNLPEWHLSFQNSTSTTPTSNGEQVPFRNLIATRDPPWTSDRDGEVGRLALVAHYDSKLTPEGFIGAIDSAAPCAMLLHAARTIDFALTYKWSSAMSAGREADDLEENKGIQILLLDGEEAFNIWTSTDSLYGARALAEEWEGTFHPSMSTYSTPLASIDLFVLLDLLGSKGSTVPSYFKTTHWAYLLMADLEVRLRKTGMFKSSPNHSSKRSASSGDKSSVRQREPLFLNEASKKDSSFWAGGHIGDDHVPFMERGVEILHLIPGQFPDVWHEIEDDGEHLDIDSVEDWAMLTAAFAAEWLDLEGFFEGGSGDGGKRGVIKDELPSDIA